MAQKVNKRFPQKGTAAHYNQNQAIKMKVWKDIRPFK